MQNTRSNRTFWGNISGWHCSPHLPVETLCINYELDLDRSQPTAATRKKDGQRGKTKTALTPTIGNQMNWNLCKGLRLGWKVCAGLARLLPGIIRCRPRQCWKSWRSKGLICLNGLFLFQTVPFPLRKYNLFRIKDNLRTRGRDFFQLGFNSSLNNKDIFNFRRINKKAQSAKDTIRFLRLNPTTSSHIKSNLQLEKYNLRIIIEIWKAVVTPELYKSLGYAFVLLVFGKRRYFSWAKTVSERLKCRSCKWKVWGKWMIFYFQSRKIRFIFVGSLKVLFHSFRHCLNVLEIQTYFSMWAIKPAQRSVLDS